MKYLWTGNKNDVKFCSNNNYDNDNDNYDNKNKYNNQDHNGLWKYWWVLIMQ